MNSFISTSEILQNCHYTTELKEFSRPAWKAVSSQVSKLETKQFYSEKNNPSFELLMAGKFDEAINLIPNVRSVDIELYDNLKQRNVKFVRCRPVKFPLNDYLKWEIECYKFNADHGEKIYLSEFDRLQDIFVNFALHDFTIYDEELAIIIDHDSIGLSKGWWIVRDVEKIQSLVDIFSFIYSQSIELMVFLKDFKLL